MKLMAAQLTGTLSQQQQQQQQMAGWQLAALQLPLLQQVVFATHKTAKRWAAAVLKCIRTQQQQQQGVSVSNGSSSSSSRHSAVSCSQEGPLAPLVVVQQLLAHWEATAPPQQQQQGDVLDAVTWLHSFAAALQQQQQQQQQQSAAGPSTQPAALAAWCVSQGISPAVQLLLAALLQHRDAAVVSAAASVLQLLLLRVPQLAPAFLPVVLQQLRLSYRTTAAAAAAVGVRSEPAGQQVQQLLMLLPAMCKDASCAALVWRVLQPVMSAAQQRQQQQQQQAPYLKQQQGQSGGLLRAVAVQLCVSAWGQRGRGWGRAEAAVNGCISMSGVLPQDRGAAMRQQPLELRLARAAAVRYVCGKC
jgi:hypothetical protein